MKYLIDKDYYFCGWEGLPFAIYKKENREPFFMNKEQFNLLWLCDGKTDIDRESLEGDNAKFFDLLIKSDIIRQAPEGSRLQLHKYKKYPCKYRQDVQLSITGKCNYRCRHCFQSAPHGLLGQPTTEQVCSELDQLAECGVKNIAITGGEPLIHEGFWNIVDHIIDLDLALTTIYSNGKLVNQKLIEEFKKRDLKPSWQISFDGLGQHDYIRGVDGAEEAAIKAIKLLIANDFPVGCAYTLTKRTLPVFAETIDYLASLGVHSVKSGCTQAQGEWLDCKDEWLTDQDYLDFYKQYIPEYIQGPRLLNVQFEGLFVGNKEQDKDSAEFEDKDMDTQKEEQPYYFIKERELSEDGILKVLSCESLATSFYVGPTGRVLPCMGMDNTPVAEEFDTLWEKPLKEILSTGSRFIEATSYTISDVFDHNEECKDCQSRRYCASGCRVSAIGDNGSDYLALDKRTCMLCKEDWAGQIKKVIK